MENNGTKRDLENRYELIDKDGNSWGFFDTAARASGLANRTWPDQEQDPDRTGRGWDIQAIR